MAEYDCIIFDLDDTLHDFSHASEFATQSLFNHLNKKLNLPIDQIAGTYQEILFHTQNSRFVEDLPSSVYRSRRFIKLLESFNIQPGAHIDECLQVYDCSLAKALRLKERASELLKKSKQKGYKNLILTEGPYDAQETTLKRLGILHYADELLTSSRMGVHKENGLYNHALHVAGCEAERCLAIGDHLQRDIYPALALNMKAIWVPKIINVTTPRKIKRINSLKDVLKII